jgi:hypothetical protein
MRIGYLAVVLALPAVVACGESYDQSVSGVFPSSAFLGRKVRVEISGDVTSWKDGTTVDFGPGVTVQSVKAASPTTLFAEITVADDAAPGLRDVTVDGKLVLKEAFQLESAITLKFRGMAAQGSIATFSINNHDFDTPFDDTSTGDGFFTPIEYTNTFVETPSGVRLEISSVSPYTITGTAFFDVDAAPGPVVVNSGLDADLVKSGLGIDLPVTARAATALVANTAATGMVAEAFDSALYEFTPAASPALATFRAASTSQAATPAVALLPGSGKFDEMLAYGPNNALVQQTAGKTYAVYFDNGGGFGYNFTVTANGQMLTAAAEAEPNNAIAQASVATVMPFLMTNGSLAGVADVDWIRVNITNAELGKKIRIVTTGNDPMTDTVVQVFKSDGTTAFGLPSGDEGYHENHTSPVINAAAGTGAYYVKVTASQDYFMDAHNQYIVAVWLE